MKPRSYLVLTLLGALAAWMPPADAQDGSRHETRSGVLEFEANGYPTDATVRLVQEEIDYQRAVQAYIHFIPAVGIMQWRNGHFGPLGGKAGDLIVYRTTEQKMPIITANDTTTYVITFAELSDTGGLLMYEVPPGPTGGGVIDLWQRPVSDTGMVGPDRGNGGKFLIVLEGTKIPENHGADFVITSKTSTVLIGTRILTPDPVEGQRILNAHKIYGLGQESGIRIFEAPNRDWEGHHPRGLEYWKVVLYDYDTRCMIENPQGKTEVNSRQEIVTNADGSVRLVFSPQKPAGVPDANWIQTNPEKGFFAYFRWYSPTQAFFDRSWKMGNIVEVK